MLSTVDLSLTLDKKSYAENMKSLKNELRGLQQEVKTYGIPVIIVFEGWSSSGKGTQMSGVIDSLDPRQFNVHTLNRVQEDAAMRPYLWSFCTKMPGRGRFALLDRSWLMGLMPGGGGFSLNAREKKGLLKDINAFEEHLIDDGNVIIKFFLHIGKAEQKKRFTEIENDPATKWRVTREDWEQNENYEKYKKLYEDLIMSNAPMGSEWEVVASTDRKYALVRVYKIIIEKLRAEIERRKALARLNPAFPGLAQPRRVSVFNSTNLSLAMDDDEYKKKLGCYREKMSKICFDLYQKRTAVIIVFEGWDAAGKGGAIKRLTEALDPRGYEVIPITAPSAEELSHHYLWRFWTKMPKDGHIAIFDRSWYGRVMVERIEGFCTEAEWRRAYKEINDMELSIANHGVIIMKFWLHIDKDEQLARFTSRQENPAKQYKITDEDWRNREKWDAYETAVNDMLNLTDTPNAPWHIIESNNKKYARVKVIERVVETLSRGLYG